MPILNAIGLVVDDMASALAFYRALGLDFPEGSEKERHVESTLPSGLRVMFDTVEVVRSFTDWEPPTGDHRMGFAFLCEDAAEVDATWNRMVNAGFDGKKAPWDAFWGQRYAQLLDPSGNPVDLFAPLG